MMLKTGIRWVLELLRDASDVALECLDDEPATPAAEETTPPSPASEAAPVTPTSVTAPDRRRAARAATQALSPIAHVETVEGVVETLARILGTPTRRRRKVIEWDCGRGQVVVSVQKSDAGVTGITIYDGPSPMTWRITGRRTLDYAVRGLLWHLAEMDVFPLETLAT